MAEEARRDHAAKKKGIGRTTALPMLLCVTAVFALLQTSIADTIPATGWGDTEEPAMQDLPQGKRPPTSRESGRFTQSEQLRERRNRFSRRALDDLQNSLNAAREESVGLEREVDRIALLESPKRETDLQALLMISLDFADWLRDEIADIQTDLTADADGGPLPGIDWQSRYGAIITQHQEYARQVDELVKSYSSDLQRLTEIVERRRLLRDRSLDLEMRLADIEQSLKQLTPSSPERAEKERRARRFRDELRITQTELLSLDDIDENLLKHLAVMIERGRGWLDWLALKMDEYLMLGEVSEVIDRDTSRDAPARESAYRRVIRGYEKERNRLRRTIDQLDRKRELVTPAGSIRDVDRSREMLDFLEQLKGRYSREMLRVDLQIGAWETELSEALSTK
ncbi:hypothetical protein EG829_05215 [bacterium]|nr:hypothetical protein [bacterium]